MFTERQLLIAAFILTHISDKGAVVEIIDFDKFFLDFTPEADNLEELQREIWFVTACLEKDFNLIRRITKDNGYGEELYTGLTKQGAKALKDGLPKYLRNLEKEENRTIITKYWTFWASLIATLISVTTFIFGFGKLG